MMGRPWGLRRSSTQRGDCAPVAPRRRGSEPATTATAAAPPSNQPMIKAPLPGADASLAASPVVHYHPDNDSSDDDNDIHSSPYLPSRYAASSKRRKPTPRRRPRSTTVHQDNDSVKTTLFTANDHEESYENLTPKQIQRLLEAKEVYADLEEWQAVGSLDQERQVYRYWKLCYGQSPTKAPTDPRPQRPVKSCLSTNKKRSRSKAFADSSNTVQSSPTSSHDYATPPSSPPSTRVPRPVVKFGPSTAVEFDWNAPCGNLKALSPEQSARQYPIESPPETEEERRMREETKQNTKLLQAVARLEPEIDDVADYPFVDDDDDDDHVALGRISMVSPLQTPRRRSSTIFSPAHGQRSLLHDDADDPLPALSGLSVLSPTSKAHEMAVDDASPDDVHEETLAMLECVTHVTAPTLRQRFVDNPESVDLETPLTMLASLEALLGYPTVTPQDATVQPWVSVLACHAETRTVLVQSLEALANATAVLSLTPDQEDLAEDCFSDIQLRRDCKAIAEHAWLEQEIKLAQAIRVKLRVDFVHELDKVNERLREHLSRPLGRRLTQKLIRKEEQAMVRLEQELLRRQIEHEQLRQAAHENELGSVLHASVCYHLARGLSAFEIRDMNDQGLSIAFDSPVVGQELAVTLSPAGAPLTMQLVANPSLTSGTIGSDHVAAVFYKTMLSQVVSPCLESMEDIARLDITLGRLSTATASIQRLSGMYEVTMDPCLLVVEIPMPCAVQVRAHYNGHDPHSRACCEPSRIDITQQGRPVELAAINGSTKLELVCQTVLSAVMADSV